MQDEAASPTPNPVFPRTSQLRRAFFSDLDHSPVTPGRRQPSRSRDSAVLGAKREDASHAVPGRTSPPHERAPAVALFTEEGLLESPRRSVNPREDYGDEDVDGDYDVDSYASRRGDAGFGRQRTAAQELDADTQGCVRATSAIVTNVVAGSLCGVFVRRVSSSALAAVGAGVLVTQLLCYMGYAKVRWKALMTDTFSLVFQGAPPPSSPEEMQGLFGRYWRKLLSTLTLTASRRSSFWLGVAGGFLLL